MTLFQPAVYMRNLIGVDLAFFFSFVSPSLWGIRLFLQLPSSSSSSSSRSSNQLAGIYLGWFCWPGGVGQIDMRIIDKLQSIDRSLDCRHSWKIEDCIAAGSGQGGVAAVAPPDSSRNYGIQIGTALGRTTLQLELGAGNWQLVTGNVQSATCSVQPVQHQLQLSLFLNGIIYTAVSQMPSAFSAMFTVVYFVVHLRRAHRIAHGALPQFPLTLSIPSIPFLSAKTTTEKDPHNHLQSPCRLQ